MTNQSQTQWMKTFNSIHKYSSEELEVLRQAKEIATDPRFYGTWNDALNIAIELKFGVQEDNDAMRITSSIKCNEDLK